MEVAMARFKRRLLISAGVILLVLAGMVVFFWRPTRLALERAEAFQFRRMLVTKQADKGIYRFFTSPTAICKIKTGLWMTVSGLSGKNRSSSGSSIPPSSQRWTSA